MFGCVINMYMFVFKAYWDSSLRHQILPNLLDRQLAFSVQHALVRFPIKGGLPTQSIWTRFEGRRMPRGI